MEEFQVAIEAAKKNIRIADHMLIMTFPLVKDPKLLLAVLENTFSALSNAMFSIVYYERLFKRIPQHRDTFESKFNLFQTTIVPRHSINKEYVKLIQEIREVLLDHKKSPVEFSRGDRFVICSENYHVKTIGVPELKKQIMKTKLFVSDIERLVSKNAGIFK
ncbi:MAG: hypothetical protein KJ583_00535 [Nanoarchaeota archaeon]|nr:hypothetical protein [Nanoarchaeota archaeon]MBU1269287.1 hypothetical protein [Nanoarchaeota archaeon]MBU1603776.1 hypothetical protein [Nanoarchaeota archaeon]MBU2443901.1 hypothetical protein [Nanoarchaeota archaeon]